MHASLRRLAAVCAATAAVFGLAVGGSGAGARDSSCPALDHHTGSGPSVTGTPIVSQVLGQRASTDQDADAGALSVQVLPANLNVPVQVLSAGSNGGDTHQGNTSVAAADADNRSTTVQLGGQSQQVTGVPTPDDGHGTAASQDADQHARTDQDADAHSASVQVLPINVNAPIQVLSAGSNGGDTHQGNTSVGSAQAGNSARTFQGALQHQLVTLG
jgi:hypothetical protein